MWNPPRSCRTGTELSLERKGVPVQEHAPALPDGAGRIRLRAFLVGCPRSGTTLLQSLLSAHSRIHSLPETHFFQNLMATEDARRQSARFSDGAAGSSGRIFRRRMATALGWVPRERVRRSWLAIPEIPADMMPAVSAWPMQRMAAHARGFVVAMDRQCLRQGKRIWLEKTPDHLFYLAAIRRCVPRARFIHLLRDGEEVVASLYRAAQAYPQWRPFLDIERAADRWNRAAAESLRWCGRSGHLLVRYETLMSEPETTLAEVLRFLDCPEESGLWQRYAQAARPLIRGDEPWKQGNLGAISDRRKFFSTFERTQRRRIKALLRSPDWWSLQGRQGVVA